MTGQLAVLNLEEIATISVVGFVLGCIGLAAARGRTDVNLQRLKLQVSALEKKLDLLLERQGISLPPSTSGFSPELEQLASQPETKIAAIKRYRLENPGAGLSEAKERIEAFYNSRR